MDPIAAILALWALSDKSHSPSGSALTLPTVSTLPAYKVDFYGMMVIQLSGTNSLALFEEVGFVTDNAFTKVLALRYGSNDKAQSKLANLKDTSKPKSTLTAQYWTLPRGIVMRGSNIATTVIDEQNIATVDDTGRFLGHVFQGTTQTASALISSMIAAGADLSKQKAVVGSLGEALSWLDGKHPTHHARGHHGHHGHHGMPHGYHRAHRVIHLFR